VLENIKDAIKTYLETVEILNQDKQMRYVEVPLVTLFNIDAPFIKARFRVIREGKHISRAKDGHIFIILYNNPIHAFTLGGIIKDAGLSIEEFKKFCNNVSR